MEFENAKYLKLRQTKDEQYNSIIESTIIEGETILSTYKTVRDGVVFTNKRIIAISIEGITGKKKNVTVLPYRKIQAYAIETAGHFDLDSELQLWFSSLGTVTFEFSGSVEIDEICYHISKYVL